MIPWTAHNLLTTALFEVSIAGASQTTQLSLPALLHTIWHHDVLLWHDVLPHQELAWHLFLVQLSTLAVAHHTPTMQKMAPSTWSQAHWQEALLTLTRGDEHAWDLVQQEGVTGHGVFQPAPGEGITLDDYGKVLLHPEELTMLTTAKNHDYKKNVARHTTPTDWFMALLTLQTMQGVYGNGNYGIVRMNGGYGHRSYVSVVPGVSNLSHSARIRHDVHMALLQRTHDDTLQAHTLDEPHCTLMWTEPWGKYDQLDWMMCDPHTIEVCRRIRLEARKEDGVLYARQATSTQMRTMIRYPGITQDPWSPTTTENTKTNIPRKVLTLKERGYTFKHLAPLLRTPSHHGWEAPFSLSPHAFALVLKESSPQAPPLLWCEALVRGQGKLEGYFCQTYPIPQALCHILALPYEDPRRKQYDLWLDRMTHAIRDLQYNVLSPGLRALALGEPQVQRLQMSLQQELMGWYMARLGVLLEHHHHDITPLLDDTRFEALTTDASLSIHDMPMMRPWIKATRQLVEKTLKDACLAHHGQRTVAAISALMAARHRVQHSWRSWLMERVATTPALVLAAPSPHDTQDTSETTSRDTMTPGEETLSAAACAQLDLFSTHTLD